MDAAEAYAAEHGCLGVTLETHSFQALGFLSRSVATRCSALWRTVRPGHTKFFLRKRLA